MVAFKLMLWSWKLGKERRGGLTTPQFVRADLMRLEMGEDLTHIVCGGTVRSTVPEEEVLALQAEAWPTLQSPRRSWRQLNSVDSCPRRKNALTAGRGGCCLPSLSHDTGDLCAHFKVQSLDKSIQSVGGSLL
jgi:hypothetical protein